MRMACNPFHQSNPGFARLYIFGAAGSGREVAWLAEQCWGADGGRFDGALIAAGACVTKSVDVGALVAGVPAMRKRWSAMFVKCMNTTTQQATNVYHMFGRWPVPSRYVLQCKSLVGWR